MYQDSSKRVEASHQLSIETIYFMRKNRQKIIKALNFFN